MSIRYEAEVDCGVVVTVTREVEHRIPPTGRADPSREEGNHVALLAHRHLLRHLLRARVLESGRKGGASSGDIIINTTLKMIVQHLHQGRLLQMNGMTQARRRK